MDKPIKEKMQCFQCECGACVRNLELREDERCACNYLQVVGEPLEYELTRTDGIGSPQLSRVAGSIWQKIKEQGILDRLYNAINDLYMSVSTTNDVLVSTMDKLSLNLNESASSGEIATECKSNTLTLIFRLMNAIKANQVTVLERARKINESL